MNEWMDGWLYLVGVIDECTCEGMHICTRYEYYKQHRTEEGNIRGKEWRPSTHPPIYLLTHPSTYSFYPYPSIYLSTYLPELNSPPLLYSSTSTSLYFNPMLTLYTLAQAWISGDTVSVALESDEVSSWWNNCGIGEYNDDDDDGDDDDRDRDDDRDVTNCQKEYRVYSIGDGRAVACTSDILQHIACTLHTVLIVTADNLD